VKQKTLVSAIKKILGAEILLSAAFMTTAYAQSAPTPASGAAAPTAASAASTGGVTQLQKVQVTGSLIRSSDKVGYNQVQTITAAQIQASGAVTVADFMRDTAANSASSWGESNPDSFAPGGAGIALRGLSEKYTLVLIDGVRVAPYAFAVNLTDSFFDLNTIPLNMVDHIEIVKTGAVSQYGSDAIAGVVNIITKKNFQGVTLDGSLGGATNPGSMGTTKFGVTAGFGDLNSDRFNVTVGASYFKQNGFSEADRSNTSSQDFSNQAGGTIISPVNYWEQPGTQGQGAGIPFGNCAPGQKLVSASQTSAGNAGCSFNAANTWSLEPEEERANVKVHATFKLSDTTEAYADLMESRNTTTSLQGLSGINDSTVAYNPVTGGVTPISNLVAAGNQFNPNPGVATPITYTFPGAIDTIKTTANYFRAATGIKGSFTTPSIGDWDWAAEVSHSQSIVDNSESNVLSVAGLANVLGPNGQYNFANPASTPNGLAGLYTSDSDEAISMLDTVGAHISTANLFSLPAGDVGLGFGTEFNHESEFIGAYGNSSQGTTLPLDVQTADGQRNVAAAYYQLDVPLLTGLSFSQSGRYDHYSDFGGAFSPRFAFRWQPFKQFTAYASYSRGFRAPTLVENSQSTSYSVQTTSDPFNPNPALRGPNGSEQILEKTDGNPNLQPERTRNYNVGFELSPTPTTDFGMDWYKIDIKNVIGSGDINAALATNDPTVVHRNAAGEVSFVDTSYLNLGNLETDGFEATFRKALPTNVGTFTLSGDIAYVWHFNVESPDGNTFNCAGNNQCLFQPFGAAFPRWKGNVDLAWNYRKFNTTLEYQYTGPYTADADFSGSIASMSVFNLNVTYTGIKNWTIYGGINNIFNRLPPYDAIWTLENGNLGYDASLYNDDGRFVQIGASYHF